MLSQLFNPNLTDKTKIHTGVYFIEVLIVISVITLSVYYQIVQVDYSSNIGEFDQGAIKSTEIIPLSFTNFEIITGYTLQVQFDAISHIVNESFCDGFDMSQAREQIYTYKCGTQGTGMQVEYQVGDQYGNWMILSKNNTPVVPIQCSCNYHFEYDVRFSTLIQWVLICQESPDVNLNETFGFVSSLTQTLTYDPIIQYWDWLINLQSHFVDICKAQTKNNNVRFMNKYEVRKSITTIVGVTLSYLSGTLILIKMLNGKLIKEYYVDETSQFLNRDVV